MFQLMFRRMFRTKAMSARWERKINVMMTSMLMIEVTVLVEIMLKVTMVMKKVGPKVMMRSSTVLIADKCFCLLSANKSFTRRKALITNHPGVWTAERQRKRVILIAKEVTEVVAAAVVDAVRATLSRKVRVIEVTRAAFLMMTVAAVEEVAAMEEATVDTVAVTVDTEEIVGTVVTADTAETVEDMAAAVTASVENVMRSNGESATEGTLAGFHIKRIISVGSLRSSCVCHSALG
mmetsp:Transcript_20273/g.20392  ORF Transcript_20273/g.20392 Transcript_20273/m.20392 type:complete len:236 (+) Transcript_20273:71-778(+)